MNEIYTSEHLRLTKHGNCANGLENNKSSFCETGVAIMRVVSIEGNIGCGKSTLLHDLSTIARGRWVAQNPVK